MVNFIGGAVFGNAYEVWKEVARWAENPSQQAADKTKWTPVATLAQSDCESLQRLCHIAAVVSSIGALVFGGFFLAAVAVTSNLFNVLLADGKTVIASFRRMQSDKAFRNELTGPKTVEDRVSAWVRGTLLLSKLPISWVIDAAYVGGIMVNPTPVAVSKPAIGP